MVCYKNKSSFVNCFNIADVVFFYIIHYVPIINSFHTHDTLDNTIWYTEHILIQTYCTALCNIYQYVYVVCVCVLWCYLIEHAFNPPFNLRMRESINIYCWLNFNLLPNQTNNIRNCSATSSSSTTQHTDTVHLLNFPFRQDTKLSIFHCYKISNGKRLDEMCLNSSSLHPFLGVECRWVDLCVLPLHIQLQSNWKKKKKIKIKITETPPSTLCWWSFGFLVCWLLLFSSWKNEKILSGNLRWKSNKYMAQQEGSLSKASFFNTQHTLATTNSSFLSMFFIGVISFPSFHGNFQNEYL